MLQSRMQPRRTVRWCTRPFHGIGQSDLGTIKTGKLADLVLLDADPLADIRNTRRIRAVVSRGKVIDRAGLEQLLARAAIEAQAS
jgi:imidazolonepropionase-like amidohydrolase